MSGPHGFFRATAILGLARIVQQGLLFVQLALFLFIFGSDATTDAWNIARALPFFFAILFKFSLSQLFIPVFAEWRFQQGEEEAWRLTSLVLVVTLVFLLGLSVLITLAAPIVPRLLAPGLDPEHQQLCAHLLQQFSVFIAVSGMCGIPHAIYYSYRSFTVPALSSVFVALGTIGAMYFFSDRYGIYCVPAGGLAGAALELLAVFLLLNVGEQRFRFRPCVSHPGATQFLHLIGPRMITVALAKVSMFVDQFFASYLGPASISALTYADRINQAPVGLVGSSVGTVSFSELSDVAARRQFDQFRTKLERHVRIVALVSIPIIVLLLFLARPMIEVLFQRGAFGETGVRLTAIAVAVYSIGLLPLVITSTIRGSLFALQDVSIPLKVSSIQFFLNIIFNLLFIRPFGLAGVALATTVSQWIALLLMYRLFERKVGFALRTSLWPVLAKLAAAGIAMSLCLWLFSWGPVGELTRNASPYRPAWLAVITMLAAMAYYFSCLLLGVSEAVKLSSRIRRRFGRRARAARSGAAVGAVPSDSQED